MAPTFSKEAVLQGSIDNLCLVCESHLRSERDVDNHVSTTEHKENLDKTQYADKYRDDRIRKIKKWYFCEFCNVLVSTTRAVTLHVKEPRHVENRSSKIIKKIDDVITAGNIIINEDAWNGFVDENTCVICNEEYDDKAVHKNDTSHVVNLIQSKISGDNNNVYRKIDDTTFHCLTCNEVVANIMVHFDETKHKLLLQSCIKAAPSQQNNTQETMKVNNNTDQKLRPNTESAKDNNTQASDILNSIPEFQKNNININLESRTTVCRKCSINLEFNCKEIEKHIEEHNHDVQTKASGAKPKTSESDEKKKLSRSETLFSSPVFRTPEGENKKSAQSESMKRDNNDNNTIQTVAEQHGLTYIPIENKVHCQCCNKYIPSSTAKIISHVNEELHKSRKAINSKDNEVTKKRNTKKCMHAKVPFFQFLRNGQRIRSMATDDIVVNEKYSINVLSFYFLTTASSGQIRCQVCETNLLFQDVDDHTDLPRHERAMKEIPLIILKDSEFVREVRSGVYQCGYCNIYDSWEGIENHLKSTEHKEKKTFANNRLTQHLPTIAKRRMARQIEEHFMRMLLS